MSALALRKILGTNKFMDRIMKRWRNRKGQLRWGNQKGSYMAYCQYSPTETTCRLVETSQKTKTH